VLLLREFHRHWAISHLKMVNALVLDTANGLLQVGILALCWYFGWVSAAGAYFVMGVAAGVVCLEWFLCDGERWCIAPARIARDWRHNWSFARWALASHLTGCATPYIMPWIVAVVAGKGAAGLYGACVTLAGVASMFVVGLSNYISPKARRAFAYEGKAALCRVLGKAASVFGVVVGGLCLLCLVGGEDLMLLVYGGQYAGGGPVLAISMLSVLALSLQIVAGNGLWAMELPKATFVADLCALVVTLGTAALLVGPLGPMGAALASLAGTTIGAMMKGAKFLQRVRALHSTPLPKLA
jgi:O-antigen/teichoic acid export membrane protein